MVDPGKIVRAWLLNDTAVSALLGSSPGGSVYYGDLPAFFDPKNGPGIQLTLAGGVGHSEIVKIIEPRITLKAIAQPSEHKVARVLFSAVYDLMHGANMVDFGTDGRILSCQAASIGQDVSDPDSGWATVVGMFSIEMIQTN